MPARLKLDEFLGVIREVVAQLPEPFRTHLENVAIDVEERPSMRTLRELGIDAGERDELMGLFQGAPLTEQHYGEHHPNRITLYRRSIERAGGSRAEVAYEIRRTLIHELAHHFGYSEEQLEAFEAQPSPFDGGDQHDTKQGR